MSIDPSFPWNTLRSIIGGLSAIDVPRLHTHDADAAERFLECYGFDWNVPEHRSEAERIRQQAVHYIETKLLAAGQRVPPQVRDLADARELLVWASRKDGSPEQAWACAVLRVAHTHAHAQSHFNETYGAVIREQILARFEPHLRRIEDGLSIGGVELVDFQTKPHKPLESVVTKLLHKVENVAEDVFDRVGVRFVTKERFDTLLVVKYLRQNNVVMFANVKPSRSRNTLIDLDWLEQFMEGLESEDLSETQRLERLRAAVSEHEFPGPAGAGENQHSSPAYHSIQFTGRQMIRIGPAQGSPAFRFFFPFEVQILDEASYQLSRSGFASHDLYKARQLDAVRTRVLGGLRGE